MGISSEFSDEFPPSGQFFHELPASAGNFFTNCPLNFLFSENYRMFVWSQQEPLGPQLGPLWTKQKLSTFSFSASVLKSKTNKFVIFSNASPIRQSGKTSAKVVVLSHTLILNLTKISIFFVNLPKFTLALGQF